MFYRCILISLLITFGLIHSKTQNTYSKLFPLKPFPAANFNAVLITDTAYFMIGVVSDSLYPFHPKPIFVRTDIDGNIQVIKMYKDGNKNFETWHQGMYFDNQGNIVTNGYIFNHPDKRENFFIRYLQSGEVDTVIGMDYSNNNIDVTYPMLKAKDGNYIIPVNSNPHSYSTNVLFKLDQYGNVLDTITYNANKGNLLLIRMDTTKNGFIIGGWQAPLGPVKDGINQTIIVEFDTQGNKIWEYESTIDEDWCGTLGGIVVNDNDEIIYVSGQGHIYDSNSVSDYFNYKWYVTKIDRNKNIVWRTLIPSTTESPAEACRFWNIIKLMDNKSYITMGMDFKSEPRYYGWIAKFNDDGELLWNRKYNVEDRKGISYEIRDLAEDSYGNLIMVGERLNWDTISFNAQQAWHMKLDRYGCLIPGCHLVNNLVVNEGTIDIKIYPNPATDFLTFKLGQRLGQVINQYCIKDNSGQIVKSVRPIEVGTNYIIHTHDFPRGMYIIQFLNDGSIIQSKKFIVSH